MTDHLSTSKDFWNIPLAQLLEQLKTTPEGLTTAEAQNRIRVFGPNTLQKESRFTAIMAFFRYFLNPLVLILLVASIVSLVIGEQINASIILAIILLGVILNFLQEYQARHAAEALRQQVALTAEVIRDKKHLEIPVSRITPGDIIQLNAGDLVPADARLLQVNDLHVRESALTGESFPVEKRVTDLASPAKSLAEAINTVFLGTFVQSGIGTAVVVHTGKTTEFGGIAARLIEKTPETEFDHGIRHFGIMISRIIGVLILFVFLIDILFKRPILESFLFALALAVGLTPELLPMIISVTLASGAKRMAKRKVIVKQLAAIENFGSMEILCSDKTGTLTEGDITLDRHVDITGDDDPSVLRMLYINSHFEAGIKSPLDDAVLKHPHPDIAEYQKIDEIPFDFSRKRLSVVTKYRDQMLIITKGSVESIFQVCTQVMIKGQVAPFTGSNLASAEETYRKLSSDGYRILGVAINKVEPAKEYERSDEAEMTLLGFGAFFDPPKTALSKTLQALKSDGVSVIIMTGDNEYVTAKIARDVGLMAENVIVGDQVNSMDAAALAYHAEHGAIFARVSPEQKDRVISALRAHGKVVGFLGDGINDAPSLHTADIGISVVNGVDVAKEAANIILLEKDLAVLHDGVIEGRRSFANIMKYITMGTSSNFGNMFSMAIASLVLPFLPMLPTQILLNNLLYDTSQISIPSDTVDPGLLRQPKRWHTNFIRQFMLIIGPISSIYDIATFAILLFLFHADERLFHTGWFVESLVTQTFVVFVIRTAANPLQSKPSWQLIAAVLAVVFIGVLIPYVGIGKFIGFVPLPMTLLGAIMLLAVTYLFIVQLVKSWFYKRHNLI